ncbi:hypothetical protein WISP_112173 [Willisornis vidua]|uniref:Uncharacterized protein n=1 Tax=Willisornis vidua TaxID=1566151 RepID=A0ABQ9CW25_9PASS|nr:hypothetical protein WISP_112173 [Willisornis vidua]
MLALLESSPRSDPLEKAIHCSRGEASKLHRGEAGSDQAVVADSSEGMAVQPAVEAAPGPHRELLVVLAAWPCPGTQESYGYYLNLA